MFSHIAARVSLKVSSSYQSFKDHHSNSHISGTGRDASEHKQKTKHNKLTQKLALGLVMTMLNSVCWAEARAIETSTIETSAIKPNSIESRTAKPQATVTIAYTEYSPYYGAELPEQGPIMQIIKEAMQLVDIEIKSEQLPWARAYEWTKRGLYDGLCCAWVRQQRLKYFHYSKGLPDTRVALFKLKQRDLAFGKISDLKGQRIGIVRGFAKPQSLTAAGIELFASDSDIQNFRKLLAERIDFVLADSATANITLENFAQQRHLIEELSPALQQESQHLVFPKRKKNAAALMQSFNKGLETLKRTGRYQQILIQHNFIAAKPNTTTAN